MQLYFIRHGQSENNLLWERTGSSKGRSEDPHLTDKGRQQAEKLAQFLCSEVAAPRKEFDFKNTHGVRLTHLYTSPMLRAVETGTFIAQAIKLPLVIWEEIHEWGGIYLDDAETGEPIGQAGRTCAYFKEHYPDLVLPDTMNSDGWWNRPFEEPELIPVRVQEFLETLLERHGNTEDRVAVVSHGGFYNNLVKTLLNLPDGCHHWFVLNNAAVTRVDFHDDGVDWAYMNRTDFLPAALIT